MHALTSVASVVQKLTITSLNKSIVKQESKIATYGYAILLK